MGYLIPAYNNPHEADVLEKAAKAKNSTRLTDEVSTNNVSSYFMSKLNVSVENISNTSDSSSRPITVTQASSVHSTDESFHGVTFFMTGESQTNVVDMSSNGWAYTVSHTQNLATQPEVTTSGSDGEETTVTKTMDDQFGQDGSRDEDINTEHKAEQEENKTGETDNVIDDEKI